MHGSLRQLKPPWLVLLLVALLVTPTVRADDRWQSGDCSNHPKAANNQTSETPMATLGGGLLIPQDSVALTTESMSNKEPATGSTNQQTVTATSKANPVHTFAHGSFAVKQINIPAKHPMGGCGRYAPSPVVGATSG
ncbi:MAG: hypothetical protein KDD53_03690 [Bdellovibrionales bacterium]|nr:hypothetical protein [Bdellovibrionales bacterium]